MRITQVTDVARLSDAWQTFTNFRLPNALVLVVATDHCLHNTTSDMIGSLSVRGSRVATVYVFIRFTLICIHMLMKRAWHVVCEIWEVWLLFKADPRKLKREQLQNPVPRKLLPSKISHYTVCRFSSVFNVKMMRAGTHV